MAVEQVRECTVRAASTGVFGRVHCTARNHHFIVDGPVHNGCPGEALTPPEIYLGGVAACGVELVQVLAREQCLAVGEIRVGIRGSIDRANPVRPDLTVFNSVALDFEIEGVTDDQARDLIDRFKKR